MLAFPEHDSTHTCSSKMSTSASSSSSLPGSGSGRWFMSNSSSCSTYSYTPTPAPVRDWTRFETLWVNQVSEITADTFCRGAVQVSNLDGKATRNMALNCAAKAQAG